MAQHLGAAKVGDDIPLTCRLLDEDRIPLNLDRAHVTIVNLKMGRRVASEQLATVDRSLARIVWTPMSPGDYAIEWHLEHSGGIDKYTDDSLLTVLPRWALVSAPIGASTSIGLVEGSATGAVLVTGTHASTIGAITQSASATVAIIATGTQSALIGDIAQSAEADVLVRGQHSTLIAAPTQSGAGLARVTGSHAAALSSIAQAAAGFVPVTGAQNVPVGFVTLSAAGSVWQGVIDNILAAGGAMPNFARSFSHRLYSGYSGPLFLLRRASDGLTTPIGFDASGFVDTAAIAAWCAGTTGTIHTRYDQTGNGRDVTQATVAAQPEIYGGGAVHMVGSLPVALLTGGSAVGTSDYWSRGDSSGFSGASAVSFWTVMAMSDVSGFHRNVVGVGSGTSVYALKYLAGLGLAVSNRSGGAAGNYRAFSLTTPIGTLSDYLSVSAAGANFSAAQIYQRGAAMTEASVSAGTWNISTDVTWVGAFNTGNNGMTGVLNAEIGANYEIAGAVKTALDNFGAAVRTLGGV